MGVMYKGRVDVYMSRCDMVTETKTFRLNVP